MKDLEKIGVLLRGLSNISNADTLRITLEEVGIDYEKVELEVVKFLKSVSEDGDGKRNSL